MSSPRNIGLQGRKNVSIQYLMAVSCLFLTGGVNTIQSRKNLSGLNNKFKPVPRDICGVVTQRPHKNLESPGFPIPPKRE
jgi:hypothetical protein